MGNTQTHAHTARRHSKHNANTERKYPHRARPSRRHTRKQHGGRFWPFCGDSKSNEAEAASSSSGNLMQKGNQKLEELHNNVVGKIGDSAKNLSEKGQKFTDNVTNLFKEGPAEPPPATADGSQAGGRRRRKGRKTNRRKKSNKH